MHQGGLGTLISPVVSLPTIQRNAEQAAPRAANSHPFKVTKATGDDMFLVRAGTCEGQLITTQTIDVGSTRPVAILAYPQYAMTIFNSEYVSASTVKTGPNAPVLTTSTSDLEDVTYVSAAGTEARALIAVIDTGDVIIQIATGNIVSVRENYGLTGVMSVDFNKAS